VAYERKDRVVVATAPDGEVIAFGKMGRTEAHNLIREIERHPGWAAISPIFGSKAMWPSTLEAKTARPRVVR
jgi:hypothetical protein